MAKGNEDDLLADAIPIDLSESDDLLSDAIPIDQVTEAAPASDGIDLAGGDDTGPSTASKHIRTFDTRKKTGDEDSKYQRKPHATGTGGIRAKTFVAKLRLDAIEHLDHQMNDWLDQHPNYEVKYVTTVVGELTGKIKEPALFMTVFI
jgi:hypothetical protein